MMTRLLVAILSLWVGNMAFAQVSVDLSAYGIKVQAGDASSSSRAENVAGSIGSDVQMEGIAVINGDVFIDGEKVPKGKTQYRSAKSGKNFEIKWGKDGNVAVREK